MCVCVCVRVCVCVCVCMCVCVCVCVCCAVVNHVYTCVFIWKYTHTCTHTCMHTHTHSPVHTTHTHTHPYLYTHPSPVHTNTHLYAHTHTHTLTCTHTYSPVCTHTQHPHLYTHTLTCTHQYSPVYTHNTLTCTLSPSSHRLSCVYSFVPLIAAIISTAALCTGGVLGNICGPYSNFTNLLDKVFDNPATWNNTYPLGAEFVGDPRVSLTVRGLLEDCWANRSLFFALRQDLRYNIGTSITIPDQLAVSIFLLFDLFT